MKKSYFYITVGLLTFAVMVAMSRVFGIFPTIGTLTQVGIACVVVLIAIVILIFTVEIRSDEISETVSFELYKSYHRGKLTYVLMSDNDKRVFIGTTLTDIAKTIISICSSKDQKLFIDTSPTFEIEVMSGVVIYNERLSDEEVKELSRELQ